MSLIRRTMLAGWLVCASLIAQPWAPMTLGQLLDRMEEHGSTIRSMSADLEQRKWTDILEEFDQGESGRFLFLKKENQIFIRKEIAKPQVSSLVIANGEMVFFQPRIGQAQKYRLGRNKDKTEFLILGFGTSREALEKAYDMKLIGEEQVGETRTWILEMVPRSDGAQAFFSKIVLWVDDQRWVPIQQKLVEPTDDYLLVRFSHVELNPALRPADFKLTLPKGTRVVGLN